MRGLGPSGDDGSADDRCVLLLHFDGAVRRGRPLFRKADPIAGHRHTLPDAARAGRRESCVLRFAGRGAAAAMSAVAVQDPSGRRPAHRARARRGAFRAARDVRRPP